MDLPGYTYFGFLCRHAELGKRSARQWCYLWRTHAYTEIAMMRQWELIQKSPIRAFLVAGSILPVLAFLISLATWTLLPAKSWSSIWQATLGFGGFTASWVYLRNRATHLSWSGVAALLGQCIVALALMWIPLAHLIGTIELRSASMPVWTLFPVGGLGLYVAWGVIRDRWWAYFVEATIVVGVFALIILSPTKPTPSRPELFEGENHIWLVGYCFLALNTTCFLLTRGWRRWQDRARVTDPELLPD